MPVSRRSAAGLSLSMLTLLSAGCSTPAPAEVRAPASVDELAKRSLALLEGEVRVPGLTAPVEIVRDQQGIPHIYAKNDHDMFFAQGYVMAQDRLWQLEMWRRWREGRLAEIFGPQAYEYDARARLMMFRGPWDEKEWGSYHPDAERLFTAWADGLNAYVAEHADNLPVEFALTGVKPEKWTARTVTLRWAAVGLDSASGTPLEELRLARDVATLGAKEANRRAAPDPWDDLAVPEGLDVSLITDDLIEAVRKGDGNPFAPGALPALEIVPEYRGLVPHAAGRARLARAAGHGRQQQLGGQRQAVAHRRADRLQRPAPHHRDAVAALLRAPGVAGLERDRGQRAALRRRGCRQQRPHGLGLHLRRHRHGRHLRRGDQSRRPQPDPLPGRVGTDADRS